MAAAGPLGQELAKFPLLFSAAVVFGNSPARDRPTNINTATATLVNFGNGPICITCYHVIEEYRKKVADNRIRIKGRFVSKDAAKKLQGLQNEKNNVSKDAAESVDYS